MAIVVCTAGAVESVQFSCREVLHEDCVLFTNLEVPHASRYCVDGKPTRGVTIELDPTMLERLGYPRSSSLLRSMFLGKLYMPMVGQLARKIEAEAAETTGNNVLMAIALARQMVLLVLREWPRTLIRSCEVGSAAHLPRHELVRSIEIMNVTLAKEFSVPALASQLHRSTSAFSRLFTRSTGVSPHHFYSSLLFRHAAGLLATTDRSVKEIALELGFVNFSHFSSSFRSRWDVTPTEFRKQMMVEPVSKRTMCAYASILAKPSRL